MDEKVIVEYYIYSLHACIVIFVKRVGKNSLVDRFDKTKNEENGILSLASKPGVEDTKITSIGKKNITFTQTTS